MILHNEAEISDTLTCSYLPQIGGTFNELAISQKCFVSCLQDLFIEYIKDNIIDLDKTIFDISKANISIYYKNITTDDAQLVTNYLINGLYSFIKNFPLKKYTPITAQYNPTINYNGDWVELNFDLLLKQNNKTGFLHGICFVSKIDNHSKNNYFNYIKLNFLKNFFTSTRAKYPATKLHLISIAGLKWQNKSSRSYPLRTYSINEKQIKDSHIKSFSEDFNLYKALRKNPKPIPGCKLIQCPKRRECNYEY